MDYDAEINRLERLAQEEPNPAQALEHRRAVLLLARQSGEPEREAAALVGLARGLLDAGYDQMAFDALAGAITIYHQLDDRRKMGSALLDLGRAHFESGDHAGAVEPIERALPLLRAGGETSIETAAWESFASSMRMGEEVSGLLNRLRPGKIDLDTLRRMIEAARARGSAEGALGEAMGRLLDALAVRASNPAQPPAPPLSADDEARADTRAVPELLAALNDPEQHTRRIAALTLGLRGDLSAVEPLVAATHDRVVWVRIAAVRALGQLRDPRSIAALRESLEDRARDVRLSAAAALSGYRDPDSADALTRALTDEWERVRQSAAKGLRALKRKANPAVLLDVLLNEKPVRRALAAEQLAALGDASAAEPIYAAASDLTAEPQLRLAALEALVKLKDRRALAVALGVLGETGGRDQVKGMDTVPRSTLKQAALRTVGAAGDASATPALLPHLSDGSPMTRLEAIRALGAVGDSTAIPALERIQRSDDAMVPASPTERRFVRLRSIAASALEAIRQRSSL